MFGAHEEDPAPGAGGEPVHQLLLGFGAGDVEDVVGHRGHRCVQLIDGVQHLIGEEPVDEFVDAVVEGRGEEQPLVVAVLAELS